MHRGAGEVLAEAPWLDLEKGRRGQDYTVAQTMAPADDTTEATRADLLDAQIGKAVLKAIKCVFRGLVVLVWVYLIDLMRRYVTTHSLEELVFTLCPLGILLVAVSMVLCILMGSIDKCVPTTIPPP